MLKAVERTDRAKGTGDPFITWASIKPIFNLQEVNAAFYTHNGHVVRRPNWNHSLAV